MKEAIAAGSPHNARKNTNEPDNNLSFAKLNYPEFKAGLRKEMLGPQSVVSRADERSKVAGVAEPGQMRRT